MKCPKCGFVSYNYLNTCKRCGHDLSSFKAKLGIQENPENTPPPAPPATPAPSAPGGGVHAQLFDKLQNDFARRKDERRREKDQAENERLRRDMEEAARREAERVVREETARLAAENERRAAEEAQRIREESERQIQRQIEQILERNAREAEEKARADAEARAKAEADRTRAEAESRARAEAARAEAERLRRDAEKEAQQLRRQAERDAKRILLEAERTALEAKSYAARIGAPARAQDGVNVTPGEAPSVADELVRSGFETGERVKNVPTAADFLARLSEKPLEDDPPPEDGFAPLPDMISGRDPDDDPSAAARRFDFPARAEDDAPVEPDLEEYEEDEPRAAMAPLAVDEIPRGGLTVRLAAAFLDLAMLMIIMGGFLLIGIGAFSMEGHALGAAGLLRMSGPIWTLFLLVSICYYVLFLGSAGQTPGMMVFGLKVVAGDGEALGYGRSFLRLAATFFVVVTGGLGFMSIALNLDRQGWHDKIARSLVLKL